MMGTFGTGRRSRAMRCSAGLIGAMSLIGLTGCAGHTLDASEVRPTSATLNATGQCDYNCNIRFRYHEVAPSLQGWSYTPAKNIPNKAAANFSWPVSSLTPGATYHFQICGTDTDVNGELCTGPAEDGSSYSRFVTPQPMRLETYNVEYFRELDGGRDDYPATDDAITKIKDDINASGATIVALEEVRQFGSGNEAKRLADALGWTGGQNHIVYAGWRGDPNGCAKNPDCASKGVALISAYPINNGTSFDLNPNGANGGLHRQLIWGDVDLGGGKTLRVYASQLASIHLDSNHVPDKGDEAFTSGQLETAVGKIKGTMPASNKAVFMGDFNLPLNSYVNSPKPGGLGAFDGLVGDRFHDWKVDRILKVDPKLTSVCKDSDPKTHDAYAACTYSNFDSQHKPASPFDKRDYIWVKGYTMTAGRVDANCTSTGCDSDHRSYWTDITP